VWRVYVVTTPTNNILVTYGTLQVLYCIVLYCIVVEGNVLLKPIIQSAGKDISHWFNTTTKDVSSDAVKIISK